MPAKTPKRSKTKAASRRKTSPPQLLIRTSERSTFSRCPWQWGCGYISRLQPRREQPALKFGTLIHAALEERYPPGIKRGPKPAETFEKLFKAQQRTEYDKHNVRVDDEWIDMLELGIDMLEGYIEKYGKDEDWKVIASEMAFKVPVYLDDWMLEENGGKITPMLLEAAGVTKRQLERKDPLFYYTGTMDGVWQNRMDGGVRVNDYKTTSGDAQKEAMAKAVLDEQTTAYWTWGVDYLIMKKLLKARELQALDGMLFTMLGKKMRDTREQNAQGLYLNKDGTVSKKQPTPRFHRELVYRSEAEQTRARERAVSEVLLMMAMRRGVLPITKSPGTGYPSQQCQACSFRDMCELHEGGGDWKLERDSSMEQWNPYDAHEIKDAEQRS